MERVGMIGAGAMVLALPERLKIAAVQATVYDSYSPALEAARALGCEIASSAADVARRSTLIDVVVRTDEDVVQCMTGPDGVLEGAVSGTLVLLHSSILPQTVKQIEAAAQERSVFVVILV
jgi:3-hydroxyisobutyrate dehydrogenase-like beta-hydroxyacid dehydrogenase